MHDIAMMVRFRKIRSFTNRKRFPVSCRICSARATVEVLHSLKKEGIVVVERFCNDHSPLRQTVAA
jgi:hypothetical protein